MAEGNNPYAARALPDFGSLQPAFEAIRTNCHISDARHAGDYTLCVYLLKMREYYRWENNIPFSTPLPRQELSDWLTQREAHWETLEDKPLGPVPVPDRQHDPFDSAAINASLNERGFAYSSGYGRNMKPVFFFAELERRESREGYTLIVAGREFARDLAAPPAMTREHTIYIRRESLRRMLWEKIEEWRWNKPANAMRSAIRCYDFDHAAERSLEAMTETELHSALLHEIGEVEAGKQLGEDWEAMLATLPPGKAELMLRAVRDNLADCLVTLPALLQKAEPAAMHFFIGNMSNMRKALFPALVSAYDAWTVSGNTRELQAVATRASLHWLTLAQDLLDTFSHNGQACQQALVGDIENRTY
jgi:hypothetical protein